MHQTAPGTLARVLLSFLVLVSVIRAAEVQPPRCAIRGTVVNQSGVPISWAEVEAENTVSGNTYATVASKTGEYSFRDVPCGSYLVTARSPGFQIGQAPIAASRLGATGELSLRLSPAVAATTVDLVNSSAGTRATQESIARPSAPAVESFLGDMFADLLTGAVKSNLILCD